MVGQWCISGLLQSTTTDYSQNKLAGRVNCRLGENVLAVRVVSNLVQDVLCLSKMFVINGYKGRIEQQQQQTYNKQISG